MKIVILGSGSQAQEAASILFNDRNFEVTGFVDRETERKGKKIFGIEVIGSFDILGDLFKQGIHGAVVAVGFDNNIREKHFHQAKDIGFEMINVVHPSALIDPSAMISDGVVIGPGCIIAPQVRISQNSILEAGVVVGSNTQIGENVYIGVGSCIGGGVVIKRNVSLSSGSSVAASVTIGKNSKVQPGSSITEDIADEIRNNA
jgi:sugar O-acyltransferase (sialic acid O-acetyltransferase NeuD family)